MTFQPTSLEERGVLHLARVVVDHIRDSVLVHALLGIGDYEGSAGHSVVGGSWERFVIENLSMALPSHTWAGFYRTAAGAEIDLRLEISGTGGFLIAANHYIREHDDPDSGTEAQQRKYRRKTFFGMEHVQDTHRPSKAPTLIPRGAGVSVISAERVGAGRGRSAHRSVDHGAGRLRRRFAAGRGRDGGRARRGDGPIGRAHRAHVQR